MPEKEKVKRILKLMRDAGLGVRDLAQYLTTGRRPRHDYKFDQMSDTGIADAMQRFYGINDADSTSVSSDKDVSRESYSERHEASIERQKREEATRRVREARDSGEHKYYPEDTTKYTPVTFTDGEPIYATVREGSNLNYLMDPRSDLRATRRTIETLSVGYPDIRTSSVDDHHGVVYYDNQLFPLGDYYDQKRREITEWSDGKRDTTYWNITEPSWNELEKYGIIRLPEVTNTERRYQEEKPEEKSGGIPFPFADGGFLNHFACGGRKFDGGGKFFRTNLQNESPMMYQPMPPMYHELVPPMRFRPEPDNGDYVPPVSTGMVQGMPIGRTYLSMVPETGVLMGEMERPSVIDLFSDEAKARRALKQRYAESAFDDRAVSKAGAQGAWQIMPITLKDYLGRGKGKAGDLNDPEYNRRVRDWVMGIIPRDLKEFWSESDSDRAKLAKLYAAYNWGAGNLRSFLRKKRDAGVDISNPDNWVDDLNPETRRYVKYLAFDEDIPDSIYTNSAFEDAARKRGYMAEGGRLFEMGGPSGPAAPGAMLAKYVQDLIDKYKVAAPVAKKAIDMFSGNSNEIVHLGEFNEVADAGNQESLYGNHLGNVSASGGKIHIDPKNKGKFNALLKRTGKSASWFKAHGTPLQKKRATFALNARKWKHGDGGFLNNYFYDGGPYGVIPLGGDYLTYLQAMQEVSGGVIEPSVVTAALPAKFNGSQEAARRYAEGYLYGAKPVSEAMNRAGQKIFNTVDTVVGLTPTPAGAITWLGHMGADTANGEYGKVGKDLAMAAAMGLGLKALGKGYGYLRNYWDEIGNFGEDTFRAFTDGVPGRVSTNFTYAAPAARATMEAAPAVTKAVSAPYEIENLGGGYMLKSLMRGNKLESKLAKDGSIKTDVIRGYANQSGGVQKAVMDKVLASEEFAGKKSIDYNKFRKAIQDELITYDRTPDTRWATYGEDALGFRAGSPTELREINDARTFNDKRQVIEVYGTYEEKLQLRDMTHLFRDGEMTEAEYDDAFDKLFSEFSYKRTGGAKSETFTFSSPRITSGSGKHYDANTLGHSRTYTTADEPDVLHVMESQSDWAQEGKVAKNAAYVKDRMQKHPGTESDPDSWLFYAKEKIGIREKEVKSLEKMLETGISENGEKLEPHAIKQIKEELLPASKARLADAKSRFYGPTSQEIYLSDNFTSRQIQENLRYAAEKGQKKMRYPTRETAAKIEGYSRSEAYFDSSGRDVTADGPVYTYGEDVDKRISEINKRIDFLEGNPGGDAEMNEYTSLLGERMRLLQGEAKLKPGITKKEVWLVNGDPKVAEMILQKYDAFPKQFKKLYKNADVRIVTDSKGNTWYEVDVPENYLQQEWAYEEGGSMILPKMMMDKHSPDKLKKAIARLKAKKFEDGGEKAEGNKSFMRIPITVPNMSGSSSTAASFLRDIPMTERTLTGFTPDNSGDDILRAELMARRSGGVDSPLGFLYMKSNPLGVLASYLGAKGEANVYDHRQTPKEYLDARPFTTNYTGVGDLDYRFDGSVEGGRNYLKTSGFTRNYKNDFVSALFNGETPLEELGVSPIDSAGFDMYRKVLSKTNSPAIGDKFRGYTISPETLDFVDELNSAVMSGNYIQKPVLLGDHGERKWKLGDTEYYYDAGNHNYIEVERNGKKYRKYLDVFDTTGTIKRGLAGRMNKYLSSYEIPYVVSTPWVEVQ